MIFVSLGHSDDTHTQWEETVPKWKVALCYSHVHRYTIILLNLEIYSDVIQYDTNKYQLQESVVHKELHIKKPHTFVT